MEGRTSCWDQKESWAGTRVGKEEGRWRAPRKDVQQRPAKWGREPKKKGAAGETKAGTKYRRRRSPKTENTTGSSIILGGDEGEKARERRNQGILRSGIKERQKIPTMKKQEGT